MLVGALVLAAAAARAAAAHTQAPTRSGRPGRSRA
jgi:hypothetical protein